MPRKTAQDLLFRNIESDVESDVLVPAINTATSQVADVAGKLEEVVDELKRARYAQELILGQSVDIPDD